MQNPAKVLRIALLFGTVLAIPLENGPSHLADTFKLTIIHTNDVHARFEPSDKYGGPCPVGKEDECFGGVARRVTKVSEIRESTENVLLLDGGDQFQGTLWFVHYAGKATSHFMEKLQYDAMALGNHEFDNGVEGLVPFLENASWPVLSANIDASNDTDINGLFNKSTVVESTDGSRRIGIVGYTTRETPALVKPGGVNKLVFNDEIPAIQAEVNTMKAQGVDIIIAVGHAGFSVDKQVAAGVDGLDVVVGGHSNTFLYTGTPPSTEKPAGPYPVVVDGKSGKKVLVVQDFAFAKYLGKLDLEFDASGDLIKCGGNPILLDTSIPEDPDVKAEVAEWRKPLDKIAKTVVGKTRVYLEGNRLVCRLKECNLGNVMTEAMLLKASRFEGDGPWSDTSIAFWNSGGIRASIKQGNITREMVLLVFPFRNTISKITMLGKHVREILERSVANYNPENAPGGFLQMSGVRVSYSLCKPSGERVREVEVKCSNCSIPDFEPLDPEKVYPMLLSDFLIDGGDNYGDIMNNYIIDKYALEILDSSAFDEYAQLRSPITQGLEGRIKFLEDDCTTSGASILSQIPLQTLMLSTMVVSILQYNTK